VNWRIYFPGVTSGFMSPQSDPRNFALNVLSIAMLIGLPCVLPVTAMWLVPLKLSVPDTWKSMRPLEPIPGPVQTESQEIPRED